MKFSENLANREFFSTAPQARPAASARLEVLRDYLLHSGAFSAICAFFCTVFSFHWQGLVYGMTFGALFGTLFLWVSRVLMQLLGNVFGPILIYGFAGTATGAFAGALTKVLCTPIAALVLDAIYGNTIGESERAFYAVVYAGFLGGFFGLVKALFFDDMRPDDLSDGKPIVIKTELEDCSKQDFTSPACTSKTPPHTALHHTSSLLKPRYIVPKELTQESFFSEN